MNLTEFLSLDARGMAELIREKEVTSRELVQLSFEQLERVNPTLNLLSHGRKEKALREAEQVKPDQAFSGVPFLLKDISQALKGEQLKSGSNLFEGLYSKHSSHLVSRLEEAGFIFGGHTTVPEFALKNITEAKIHGPTRNPWNINYSPGGSSGGAAAAIASGVVPLAGASDGGGSIRIPASFSSLFGLKPTRGKTPVGPGAGRQWHGASIDFVLSRSVRDSAALLDILQVVQASAAFEAQKFPKSYEEVMKEGFDRPLKIAYSSNSPVGTPVSEDAVHAVEKMVSWLEEEGHHVEERENDVDGIQLMRNYFMMNSGEISMLVAQMESMLARPITFEDLEIEAWALNEAGKSVSAAEFSASLAAWDLAAEQMASFHETYDLYLTPATAFTAPEIGELTFSQEEAEKIREEIEGKDPMRQQEVIYEMFLPSLTYTPFTQLANLTGQPAMSLPIHLGHKGLPIGVQVMANKNAEDSLLKLAYQVERSDLWIGMKGNPYFKDLYGVSSQSSSSSKSN